MEKSFISNLFLYCLLPVVVPILSLWFGYHAKILSPKLASQVGRLLFWPGMLITYIDINYVHKSTKKWWSVFPQDNIIIGAAPLSLCNHPQILHDQHNVGAVINLCDEYIGPIKDYDRLGIQQLHFPTLDHYEPSLTTISEAVHFISNFLKNEKNKTIYIHCRAGHGRSAMIAFCYFLKTKKFSLDECQSFLNEHRLVRKSLFKQQNVISYYHQIQDEE